MNGTLINAENTEAWRSALSVFPRIDVCQLPEYHVAYSTRTESSKPVLWKYTEAGNTFCYPFLLTPVAWKTPDQAWHITGYSDISSIYGYSGPLSTSSDPAFLDAAWSEFDRWAEDTRIIAEFIRFSPHAETRRFAHKATAIEANRNIAVSRLPESEDALMAALDSKTRNMIRKAMKSGLEARELESARWIPAFRSLYEETMNRNASPDFFFYDDTYYNHLLSLPPGELRLFGVFQNENLISAAFALVHKQGALYHLGASRSEFSNLGANNLNLFHMSKSLMQQGVKFLNLGGGRTTAEDDPLLRFKKSNGTGVETFHIGKRVPGPDGYRTVAGIWREQFRSEPDPLKLIFYR